MKNFEKETDKLYDSLNNNSNKQNWSLIAILLAFQRLCREESIDDIIEQISEIMTKIELCQEKDNIINSFKEFSENEKDSVRDKINKVNNIIDKFKD